MYIRVWLLCIIQSWIKPCKDIKRRSCLKNKDFWIIEKKLSQAMRHDRILHFCHSASFNVSFGITAALWLFFFILALNCGGEAALPFNAGLRSDFLCHHLLLYQKIRSKVSNSEYLKHRSTRVNFYLWGEWDKRGSTNENHGTHHCSIRSLDSDGTNKKEHSGYDESRFVRTKQTSTLTLAKCFSHISCSVCFYADDSVLFTQITAE